MRRLLTEAVLVLAVAALALTLSRVFAPVAAIDNWVSDLFSVATAPH